MASYDVDVDWPRAFWIGFGVVLAAALLFVVYSFIGTFVFGVFIYYATRPLFRRVYRHVRQRTAAAMVSLFLLALPVLVLLYYTIAISLQEFQRFTKNVDLGPYENVLDPYIDVSTVVQNPQSLVTGSAGPETVVSTLSQALDFLGLIGTGLVHAFVMFAFAFYMLRDGPRLSEWGKNLLDHHGVLDQYFHEVDRSFHRVFYGNILNAIVTGAIGAITFSIVDIVAPAGLGVPYPALTGLLAGAASLIPIIGMKIVYVPISGYLAVQTAFNGQEWWFVILFFATAFLVVDTIPDLLVRPYVSSGGSISFGPFGSESVSTEGGSQPALHTGTLMFAYIFGPFLFGWYGIFLAPMLLVLIIHFARFVLPELVNGSKIQPYAVDPATIVEDPLPVEDDTPADGTASDNSVDPDDHPSSDPTTD
jgi:predicted PurR-regulated permease PerM